MIIGINGYEAIIPRLGYDNKTGLPIRVGSGEYVFELLRTLRKIDKKNRYIVYLSQKPTFDLPQESGNWRYKVIPKKTIWTALDLSFAFLRKREKVDVFFSPAHYLPLFVGVPSAVSILDLSFVHFPALFKKRDLWQLRLWTRFSAAKAKKIITISKSSRDDIIRLYGKRREDVIVAYPGIKVKCQMSELKTASQSLKVLKEKYGLGSYILFVGTLQPRKNIARLIEAFSQVRNQEPGISNLRLVIVGRKGWMWEEIFAAPKKFGVENQVKFLENVADEELPLFYKNALCFVLPSLYEGFGLPVLEAMQYGCPVITSNVSSLPEAGGDAALYFDPEDVSDITEKIKKVIVDKKLREEMIKKGHEQVKKFSWEKAARETLETLESIKYES